MLSRRKMMLASCAVVGSAALVSAAPTPALEEDPHLIRQRKLLTLVAIVGDLLEKYKIKMQFTHEVILIRQAAKFLEVVEKLPRRTIVAVDPMAVVSMQLELYIAYISRELKSWPHCVYKRVQLNEANTEFTLIAFQRA